MMCGQSTVCLWPNVEGATLCTWPSTDPVADPKAVHIMCTTRCCDSCCAVIPKFFGSKGRNDLESALGALPNPRGEFLDVIEDLPAVGHLAKDLLLGIHHCGVVAAERLSDLR